MKQLPILEPGDKPRKATWYTLACPGDRPCPRVGHSCSYFPPVGEAESGKVFIVGGANPNQSFSDVHTMDLGTHQWDMATREGLLPRYEHASFRPACSPHSIWVFGGADQSGNRNCLQVMSPEARTWSTPEVTGCPPSPRTFHTSSAAIGNQLYVFGGGERGAQPVQDVKLHVFDANTLTWSQPETHGSPPSPRHGHVMVAAGTKLFIHGGLAGDKFFDDLHCIDVGGLGWIPNMTATALPESVALFCPLQAACGGAQTLGRAGKILHTASDMSWQKLGPTGAAPVGCAAHAAVAVGHHVYMFGGMTATGALNVMYKYHTEKQHWTILQFDTSLPPGRLDHSMCVIPWPVTATSESEDSDSVILTLQAEKGDAAEKAETPSGGSHEESPTTVLLCFVFGGMNTEGEIYDDCLVTVVD